MIVGAVEVNEMIADFFQLSERDGKTVDFDLVASVRLIGSLDDQRGILLRQKILEEGGIFELLICQVEIGFDMAGFLRVTQLSVAHPIAQRGAQCVDDDGFAGPRFPCQDVEVFVEFYSDLVNEAEILNGQLG